MILGAGTIILTFFVFRTLLPNRPYFALLAAALLAMDALEKLIGEYRQLDQQWQQLVSG